MTTDATQKGVSTAEETAETQTLDTSGKTREDTAQGPHPVVERQHPTAQREALFARADEYRQQNRPDTKTAGNLGAETPDELGEPLSEEEKAAVAGNQTPVTTSDPVAEFIVKDEAGKAFFKTTVDGKEQLVPLDRARAQLQKHEAAELRLQTAVERTRALEAREAEIAKREREVQALQTRSPSVKDASGEDDAAIEKEAAELVTSLIEDDATEAAKKLAGALKKARGQAAPVDAKALVEQTTEAVIAKQSEAAQNAALADGYNAYLKEYGETVHKDPALSAWHAAKVDELVAANPGWTPKQAMLEAGKLAEEFAGIKRGSQASQPAATTSTAADPRQQRKEALQPVPQSRSAVRGVDKPTQPDNSPQAVINEMRKARGQPIVPSQQRSG